MLVNRFPEMVFWNPWLDAYFHWVKIFCETDPIIKRGYIQHPSEIPLKTKLVKAPLPEVQSVQATPSRGLCLESAKSFEVGNNLQVSITLNGSEFKADATVAWVEPEDDHYIIGVNFNDKDKSYGIRMAEQICHIEHYRRDVLQHQGRQLTEEEAAIDWVDRYASTFPEHF